MVDWIKTRIRNLAHFSEKKLIGKIQKGDTQAFETLYLTYLDEIYRYIFFRANQNSQTAEDITETVFMKAWRHINEFDAENGNLKAWLYQIARTTVIDHYRVSKHHTSLEKVATLQNNSNLEESIFKKDQYQTVLKALEILTDEQREVITLRFVEDLSHREIAVLMQKNEDAIRALQYRGLQILRKELAE